jgi:hypothetical protein
MKWFFFTFPDTVCQIEYWLGDLITQSVNVSWADGENPLKTRTDNCDKIVIKPTRIDWNGQSRMEWTWKIFPLYFKGVNGDLLKNQGVSKKPVSGLKIPRDFHPGIGVRIGLAILHKVTPDYYPRSWKARLYS